MFDALYLLAAAGASEHNRIQELFHRFGIDPPYLISQIVSFGVVAFLLYRYAFKPVLATLDERQKKISDGLRYTEEMKAKLADAEKQHAETLKKASLEAQKLVEEARAAAKNLADRETKAATEKTQQMMAKAEQAIALEHKKMLDDAREDISRLVALTAQRVLVRELSSDDRRRYAEAATRELTSV
ncbi:MAG TPA: F0F1 ATP synthase subunit B [Opitutaceae bacterium]